MGKIIKFKGVGNQDVYNPTAPFTVNGKKYLAARVEERDIFWKDERYSPKIMFFTPNNNSWRLDEDAPVFNMMEDPFKTFIDGKIILGGVEVSRKNGKFRTVFMEGRCLWSLKRFAVGPEMMKDIRLVQLCDGKIGVFTRPQGGEQKKGRIGFTIIDNLSELNKESIEKAEIIDRRLADNQWEGVNDAKLLKNGKIGVLLHGAEMQKDGNKVYKAETFVFCPNNRKIEKHKVVARRSNFPITPFKDPSIKDVLFPGEIDYDYLFYTGVSDTSVGVKQIINPYGEEFYYRKL